MSQGQLYVISAPSGAGKTTILERLLAAIPNIIFSISHTTRAPRRGEKDGVNYFFVSPDEFAAMRENNAFVEWAEVHGNFYGTSWEMIEESLAKGIDVILDIDVQGASQLREKIKDAISVFVAPPSMVELERRLRGRGTDSDEVIAVRLKNAAREMKEAVHYDHLIANDNLDEAVEMVTAVVLAARSRKGRGRDGNALLITD